MKNFARIIGVVAIDVSHDPENEFHPDIASQFVEVPDAVERGWIRDNEGGWSAPTAAPSPETSAICPIVGPIHFKMLFASPERLKAKELRATDLALDDFWDLIDDPRTDTVDLNLQSVQNAIEHTLTAVKASGVNLDVANRKAAILTGVLS